MQKSYFGRLQQRIHTKECMHRLIKSLRPWIRWKYVYILIVIHFKTIRQRTEMAHQQRMSHSGSHVIEHTVGKSRQSPPLAFVLEEDILSTCSNKIDVK